MPAGQRTAVAFCDQDQVPRLTAFRELHPATVIGMLGYGGPWQAVLRQGNGSMTVTRYELRDLLDKLDELLTTDGGST